MLIEHRGATPRVAATAYVAPTAVVCGDVEIGDECRIMSGAVLVAEDAPHPGLQTLSTAVRV